MFYLDLVIILNNNEGVYVQKNIISKQQKATSPKICHFLRKSTRKQRVNVKYVNFNKNNVANYGTSQSLSFVKSQQVQN